MDHNAIYSYYACSPRFTSMIRQKLFSHLISNFRLDSKITLLNW